MPVLRVRSARVHDPAAGAYHALQIVTMRCLAAHTLLSCLIELVYSNLIELVYSRTNSSGCLILAVCTLRLPHHSIRREIKLMQSGVKKIYTWFDE